MLKTVKINPNQTKSNIMEGSRHYDHSKRRHFEGGEEEKGVTSLKIFRRNWREKEIFKGYIYAGERNVGTNLAGIGMVSVVMPLSPLWTIA